MAHVLFASPGVEPAALPQSTPAGEQSRVDPPGSHLVPTFSASAPAYSPAPSTAFTVGAAATAGIAVFGTIPSVRVSEPLPPLNDVEMTTLTFVFCELFGVPGALSGSVAFVNEFETVKLTVVSAP